MCIYIYIYIHIYIYICVCAKKEKYRLRLNQVVAYSPLTSLGCTLTPTAPRPSSGALGAAGALGAGALFTVAAVGAVFAAVGGPETMQDTATRCRENQRCKHTISVKHLMHMSV